VNAVATTIIEEAGCEYKKYGKISLEAIASVILNRAGGDPQLMIGEISKHK